MKKLMLFLGIGLALWFTWPKPREFGLALWEATKEKFPSLLGDRSPEAPSHKVPPVVQALMRDGLTMARRGEWDKAVISFEKAQSQAPLYPEAIHHLALAHDHASQPLIALCWYEAFLSVHPTGSVAEAVTRRISELDALVERNIQHLVEAGRKIEAEVRIAVSFQKDTWRADVLEKAKRSVYGPTMIKPSQPVTTDDRVVALASIARHMSREKGSTSIGSIKLPPAEKNLALFLEKLRSLEVRDRGDIGLLAPTFYFAAEVILWRHEEIKLWRAR